MGGNKMKEIVKGVAIGLIEYWTKRKEKPILKKWDEERLKTLLISRSNDITGFRTILNDNSIYYWIVQETSEEDEGVAKTSNKYYNKVCELDEIRTILIHKLAVIEAIVDSYQEIRDIARLLRDWELSDNVIYDINFWSALFVKVEAELKKE